MSDGLSHSEVERFRSDGFLAPVRVFEPAQVFDWLTRLEAIESRMAGRLPPSMNAKPHLLLPWLWDIVHDPRVVDRVESVLGPDILCWGTSFIAKSSQDSRYVAWHQDATYWGLSAPLALTAWIALTPSRRDNGCVRVIPGSHQVQHPHRHSRDPRNLLGRREEIVVDVDEVRAVDLVLEPGEMSLHDVLIIHGSDANRSKIRRIGFAVRYIPAHVAQVGSTRNSATLVRGRDHGHFDLELRPEADFHPDAVARHGKTLRQAMTVIFSDDRETRSRR